MAKFTASVKINAESNLKGVTKDIDKGLKKNNKSLKLNANAWKKTTKVIKNFSKVAIAGTAAAAAGILALVKSTANFGDELAKTSEKTGLTVRELQRLRFAAQIGGASTTELTSGIRFFSRAVDEAGQGVMEYQESFDRLGITVTDNDGRLRNTVDILHDVSDVFAQAEDGAAKTSLAQQLFGRGGLALIPILNEGSDAIKGYGDELERIGFLLSKDQAEASEQFNDDLLRLRTEITALGRVIAVDAIPPLNDFINQFRESLPAIRSWVDENIDLAGLLERVGNIVSKIDLQEFFDVSANKIRGLIDDIRAILEGMREIVDFISGEAAAQATISAQQNFADALQAAGITAPGATQGTLDINLTVDQEGRVLRVVGEAPENVNFGAEVPLMLPAIP
jgi:hypothetical protein